MGSTSSSSRARSPSLPARRPRTRSRSRATGRCPIGEWTFGDLTWKGGGGYEARSPIAVRGAAIDAPAEVSGTGVSGTASFDVKFGYTGAYTAVPQGLVAEVVTAGDISQDPDQTYPSADDGVGVDRIPFDLTGAAFARWELIIPPAATVSPTSICTCSIPRVTIVAASTSRRNRRVDRLRGSRGRWHLHDGRARMGRCRSHAACRTPSRRGSYRRRTGGSLSIVSAPTAAVIATTGTVTVGWTGLTAATRYLGDVAHVGPDGLLARTLVSVQT